MATWDCPSCKMVNPLEESRCGSCAEDRPTSTISNVLLKNLGNLFKRYDTQNNGTLGIREWDKFCSDNPTFLGTSKPGEKKQLFEKISAGAEVINYAQILTNWGNRMAAHPNNKEECLRDLAEVFFNSNDSQQGETSQALIVRQESNVSVANELVSTSEIVATPRTNTKSKLRQQLRNTENKMEEITKVMRDEQERLRSRSEEQERKIKELESVMKTKRTQAMSLVKAYKEQEEHTEDDFIQHRKHTKAVRDDMEALKRQMEMKNQAMAKLLSDKQKQEETVTQMRQQVEELQRVQNQASNTEDAAVLSSMQAAFESQLDAMRTGMVAQIRQEREQAADDNERNIEEIEDLEDKLKKANEKNQRLAKIALRNELNEKFGNAGPRPNISSPHKKKPEWDDHSGGEGMNKQAIQDHARLVRDEWRSRVMNEQQEAQEAGENTPEPEPGHSQDASHVVSSPAGAPVFSEPSENATQVGVLCTADVFETGETQNGWARVIKGPSRGWVNMESVSSAGATSGGVAPKITAEEETTKVTGAPSPREKVPEEILKTITLMRDNIARLNFHVTKKYTLKVHVIRGENLQTNKISLPSPYVQVKLYRSTDMEPSSKMHKDGAYQTQLVNKNNNPDYDAEFILLQNWDPEMDGKGEDDAPKMIKMKVISSGFKNSTIGYTVIDLKDYWGRDMVEADILPVVDEKTRGEDGTVRSKIELDGEDRGGIAVKIHAVCEVDDPKQASLDEVRALLSKYTAYQIGETLEIKMEKEGELIGWFAATVTDLHGVDEYEVEFTEESAQQLKIPASTKVKTSGDHLRPRSQAPDSKLPAGDADATVPAAGNDAVVFDDDMKDDSDGARPPPPSSPPPTSSPPPKMEADYVFPGKPKIDPKYKEGEQLLLRLTDKGKTVEWAKVSVKKTWEKEMYEVAFDPSVVEKYKWHKRNQKGKTNPATWSAANPITVEGGELRRADEPEPMDVISPPSNAEDSEFHIVNGREGEKSLIMDNPVIPRPPTPPVDRASERGLYHPGQRLECRLTDRVRGDNWEEWVDVQVKERTPDGSYKVAFSKDACNKHHFKAKDGGDFIIPVDHGELRFPGGKPPAPSSQPGEIDLVEENESKEECRDIKVIHQKNEIRDAMDHMENLERHPGQAQGNAEPGYDMCQTGNDSDSSVSRIAANLDDGGRLEGQRNTEAALDSVARLQVKAMEEVEPSITYTGGYNTGHMA